jgi:hypothetical protein
MGRTRGAGSVYGPDHHEETLHHTRSHCGVVVGDAKPRAIGRP